MFCVILEIVVSNFKKTRLNNFNSIKSNLKRYLLTWFYR